MGLSADRRPRSSSGSSRAAAAQSSQGSPGSIESALQPPAVEAASAALAGLIGGRIRAERQTRAGLRLDDLATRAGISVSFLSMIERGLRCPHLDTLERIAAGLALPVKALVSPPRGDSSIEELYRPLLAACSKHRLTERDLERLTAMVQGSRR